MKKLTALVMLMTFSLIVIAQKKKEKNPNLPPFGTVEKADLETKQCDFDEKAEAMVLVDDGTLEYVDGVGFQLAPRVRIKIFNKKGLDWADVKLPYRSERNQQSVSGIEAQTYNLDGSNNVIVSKVDKKLVYEKKLNKKYSEKVFTFPDVKVGSVIEYKFKHSGIGLIDWYFQRSIPVRYSHFVMDLPNELEFTAMPYCALPVESKTEAIGSTVVKTYSMKNVPALKDEPFVINEDVYRDRLETKIIAFNVNGRRVNRVVNWVQVINFLMEDEDFGVQLKRNIPRTADLDEKLKNLTSPYEKMKVIYKYVQENMQWNEYLGIWALDGVRNAWKDKKGTVGEINLILVNLLKDAALDAHPVLVSTHDNGIVNTIDAGTYDDPGFLQFNKVMAYVLIDKQVYVLDATEKELPAHLIPPDILLTQGLVIEKIETSQWGWKELWKENLIAKNSIVISGKIDETGRMTGIANINSYDYARQARLSLAKKGKDKFIETFITASNPSLTVDNVDFENMDSDSLPLVQTINFTQQLTTTGDYTYFSANMLTGLEKNPFVADNRFADVFFGYKQSYVIVGNFTIPEGYAFSELPKNMRMIMPDTSISISRVSQISGTALQMRIQLDFKEPLYAVQEYDKLHEFYKRLFDMLNEQYVLGKKK